MISFTRLKDIREDHDMKQETVAEILGVNRSTYSLWELGINIIPLEKLWDFANYFHCSIDYVLGLTNTKNNQRTIQKLDFKTLGNHMKMIRIKHNLSQENIANILGVTQACVVRYEKGIIHISIPNLYKFCKEFKISMDEICRQ